MRHKGLIGLYVISHSRQIGHSCRFVTIELGRCVQKAPPATQNASQKSSGHKNIEVWLTKFKSGHLILRKIIKTIATRCHILRLKCTKLDFCWGSAQDPAVGAQNAPPDLLAGFKGGLLLTEGYGGGNGKGEGKRGQKGRVEKNEGEGGRVRHGWDGCPWD